MVRVTLIEGLADLLAAEFDVGQDVVAFELGEVAAGRGDVEGLSPWRTRWP